MSSNAGLGDGSTLPPHLAGDADTVRDRFDAFGPIVASYEGPELRVVAANAAFRRFVGRLAVVGMTLGELVPGHEGGQLLAMVGRVFATGDSETGREWRIRAGTGMVELFLDFVADAYRDAGGTVIGVTGYGVDVTDQVQRRHAERERAAEAERRYQAARDVVVELQQALLPMALPILPNVQIGARYLVAASDQSAGGDWFDAIPLPDGRLALVVGDVVGHGVTAAAAMGQLRAVFKHVLIMCADLETALVQVDRLAASEPEMRAATMAVVLLDPATGDLRYSRCGHPPPLLVHADGRTTALGARTGPLGVGQPPTVTSDRMAPGELILLYSDGLIERPQQTLEDGLAELAAVAADTAANRVLPHQATGSMAARVCQLTVDLLTRGGYHDDVTTLAAQLLPYPVARLSVELIADLSAIGLGLAAIRAWLSGLHADDLSRSAIEAAVTEAVTNAVEHAYPAGRPGIVRLTAELLPDGACECQITDHGSWRVPRASGPYTGNGLPICERLIEELTVTHPVQQAGSPVGARGTIVTLRHRVHQPALPASGTSATARDTVGQPAFATEVLDGETLTVRVTGPVDTVTADRLGRDLSAATHGGVVPLTLDLRDVTLLASAGVRTLYDTAHQLAAHQHRLTLVTTPGSPAALILDLVDLPYVTGNA